VPKGPAALEKKSSFYTPTVVTELQKIEEELGGRTQLVGMLTLAPLTPDLRYVLGMLGDPNQRTASLAEICARGNILPGDLLRHLASAVMLKGKLKASQKIAAGIAAVTEDVMRRAAPYEAPCNGGCQGTGTITPEPTPAAPNPSPGPCEVCQGTGRLIYSPDLERQKLAIDMAQLLPKGGIQIGLQQTVNQAGSSSGGGAFEKFQEATDRVLYGSGEQPPVVDGALTEDDPHAVE